MIEPALMILVATVSLSETATNYEDSFLSIEWNQTSIKIEEGYLYVERPSIAERTGFNYIPWNRSSNKLATLSKQGFTWYRRARDGLN